MLSSSIARKVLFTLSSIVTGVVVAGALAAVNTSVSHGHRLTELEGSYQVAITVTNPPLGTFPDLMTFGEDGWVISTRPQYITQSPAGALLESPGHGSFKRVDRDTFNVALVNMLQGAPGNEVLQGALLGIERIRWEVTVDERNDNVSGPWTSTVTDANGRVLFSLAGTITGSRIVP